MKKKIAILGLGTTGLASALFLKKKGYSVFVSDSETSETLEKRAGQLRREKILFELGKHTLSKIGNSECVLLSPGIPPASEIYRSLQKKGIPLVSEIEAASWFSGGEVTAVTGTSGKTTVCTLLGRIFEANGSHSIVCGNIGNPWILEIDKITPETQVVLEVSSFQLLHTFSLHPRAAVLLNVGLNHLDWHSDMNDYVSAKLRIFQNQTEDDYAFFRRKDQETFFSNHKFRAQTIYFGENPDEDANSELLNEITRVKGLEPRKTQNVLAGFEGIEHRLEKVAEVNGVQFVNDSKCTTLEALRWGLDRFPDQKIILLAGGHAKGADFRLIRGTLHKKVKRVFVYGEARELLGQSWQGACPLTQTPDLAAAFENAVQMATPGDVVLLSPACASFDQFSHYQERGRFFKRLVQDFASVSTTGGGKRGMA